MPLQSNDELLDGIRGWVEIESQTEDVAGVNRMMDDVSTKFAALGCAIDRRPTRDGVGDLVSVTLPSDASGGARQSNTGILVLSHLDTVHRRGVLDINPWRIDGDRAYGPGTLDMKGGAYLGFAAYAGMVADGVQPKLPIRFMYIPDEEMGSRASRAMIEEAADQAKYVLVTEPGRDGGKVITGRKGTARYQLHAHGRPAHSGAKHAEGRSAIKELARHILEIESWTDYDRELTLNVGQVVGGSTDNTIPEFATARIDVRSTSQDHFDEVEAKLKALTPHDPDVALRLEGQVNRPPYTKTPAIQALLERAQGMARDIGFKLGDTITGGGSDGSFHAAQVATLDGLGVLGEGAHTLEEYLEVSSLQPRLALMRRLLEDLD